MTVLFIEAKRAFIPSVLLNSSAKVYLLQRVLEKLIPVKIKSARKMQESLAPKG